MLVDWHLLNFLLLKQNTHTHSVKHYTIMNVCVCGNVKMTSTHAK